MALLHRATLSPTKLELMTDWLPRQDWWAGGPIGRVASYRFDDPDGEVGVETTLTRGGDAVYQVPQTYRAAPLPDAERWLVGTSEHSVLGKRWIYDAAGDPVYAAALARAVRTGEGQAREYFEENGVREYRPSSLEIAVGEPGTALPSDVDGVTLVVDGLELLVVRRLDPAGALSGAVLTGTWTGQEEPVALVYGRRL
ncbi:CG0192-related protein [Virgisporangium aliadipatigenens]|nr:hypothetical protein [Virgisporangium aliadipatigenens]